MGTLVKAIGRRRVLAVMGVALFALLACAMLGFLSPTDKEGPRVASIPADSSSYVHGELIVELDDVGSTDGLAAEAAIASMKEHGFEVAGVLAGCTSETGTVVLVRTGESDLEAASAEVSEVSGVACVQPNYRYVSSAVAAASAVSDEDADQQYYLGGLDEHGANVVSAWDSVGDGGSVSVAVLDTGVYTMGSMDPVDYHQEFNSANLDMERGLDLVHSDDGASLPIVNPENPRGDDNGHGTHVAAIIAALSSRSEAGHDLGMAGVAPGATIIPIKVLDAGGEGDTASFIRAYDYLMGIADETNLRVINMSFSLTVVEDDDEDDGEYEEAVASGLVIDDGEAAGGADDPDELEGSKDEILEGLIRAASSQGIVTVCAAGNEGSTGETFPGDLDACVCVEALDARGGNADYSNYNGSKDIAAPGENIYSAWASQADAYRYLTGTSQSTAIVSGVFALLWSAEPGLTVDEAKAAVYSTAHPVTGATQHIAPGEDGVYSGSHGAIDAAAALAFVRGQVRSIADGARCQVAEIEGQEFVDGPVTPAVRVTFDGAELVQGTDYTVSYLNNVEPGEKTAVAFVQGAGAYAGWVPARFSIVDGRDPGEKDPDDGGGGGLTIGIDLSSATLSLSKTSYVYTGKQCKPVVTVRIKDGGTVRTLARGTDYTVSYGNNTNPGKAKVTVSGRGKYTGKKTAKFTISLGTTKVESLNAGKKKIVVNWTRQKNGSVGYQVCYCLKKNMKGAMVKTVRKNATTKLTLKGLKSGKRYYVQVRTYKKIDGAVRYSSWSAMKSAKVK